MYLFMYCLGNPFSLILHIASVSMFVLNILYKILLKSETVFFLLLPLFGSNNSKKFYKKKLETKFSSKYHK